LDRFTEVTAAIIRRGDRVLIARRDGGPRAGLWEFPGGKQEEGESLEACLTREILEELGLEIRGLRYFTTVEQVYPDIMIRLHAFFCRAEEFPLDLSGHHEVKWVSPGELAAFEFPEADRQVIEELLRSEDGKTVKRRQ